MKKSILLFIVLTYCSLAFAQNELLVQSSDKGLHLNHTVAPKENFYSIGRLYNISPKEIAAFNSLEMANGLSTGQTIGIPLTAANFSQEAAGSRAVYYTVAEKEGLYRVSLKNNKVAMANLRKWNRLADDQISAGKKLIVGYLTAPEAASVAQSTPVSEPQKKPAEEPRKDPPVQPAPAEQTGEAVAVKEPQKKPATSPSAPVNNRPVPAAYNDGSGGYFKAMFERQVKVQEAKADQTVSAGIFKTASGWQDAKYYALIDGIEPGTIIRIINPTNNKAVYAKVLGEMSGIRQNQGYDLRISNAAASTLDVTDTEKFIVRVNY